MNGIYVLAGHDAWYTCQGCGEIYDTKSWVTCPKCRQRAYIAILEKRS